MTIEELLNHSADDLEAMSNDKLLEILGPLIKISKPSISIDQARESFKQTKKKVTTKPRTKKPKKSVTKKTTLEQIAQELGIDESLITELKSSRKKVKL